jgi:hypothetical protein
MARRRRGLGIPGLSFSWKRAIGLSSAKARLSRRIGIPLTRSGRQRKVGRALGCCIPLALTGALFLAGLCGAVALIAPKVSQAGNVGAPALGSCGTVRARCERAGGAHDLRNMIPTGNLAAASARRRSGRRRSWAVPWA